MNKPEIVETITQYVDLKRAGQNYKGLCPFHTEKTPSFIVSPAKQRFHCFGCGTGGDVISFAMRYHGMSFKDALQELGIKNDGRPVKSDPVKARARELKRIYEAWKHVYCLYLADLLRWMDQAKILCRDMTEVEQFAEWYHCATVWEMEYDILMSKDEQAKFNLFRNKYEQQYRSAA